MLGHPFVDNIKRDLVDNRWVRPDATHGGTVHIAPQDEDDLGQAKAIDLRQTVILGGQVFHKVARAGHRGHVDRAPRAGDAGNLHGIMQMQGTSKFRM